MKDKSKKDKPAPPAAPPDAGTGISGRGKKVIGMGIALLVIGFYVLTKTNPQGDNWASTLCPFLILGGYGVIAVGIILKDPENKEPGA